MSENQKVVVDIEGLIAQGRAAEAEAILRRVLAERPHNASALVHLSRLSAQRRDFGQAQMLAARALSQAPADAAAALALADALANLGQPKAALIHFRKTMALRPDIALCRFGIGRALLRLGRHEEGKAELEAFFDRNPGMTEAWLDAAAAAVAHEGDLPGAIQLFARGLARPRTRYQHEACTYAASLFERAKSLPAEGGILASLVVWGDSYLDSWLGLTLPSLLQDGNLPALARRHKLRARIFTDAAGAKRLGQEAAMKRLAHVATIDIETMPDALLERERRRDDDMKYLVFALMHHVALHEATARRADALILFPDMVVGRDAYRSVDALIAAKDHDALITQGFVAEAEAMAAALGPKVKNHVLDIAPSALFDLAFEHAHLAKSGALMRAGGKTAPIEPGILAFAAPDGLRLRVLQPLPIWLSHRVLVPTARYKFSTPDDDLVERLFPTPESWARIRFVENAEDFAFIGLEDPATSMAQGARQVSDIPAAIADAARRRRFLDPFRRWALSHEIRIKGSRKPPWSEVADPAPLIAHVVAAIELAAAAEA